MVESSGQNVLRTITSFHSLVTSELLQSQNLWPISSQGNLDNVLRVHVLRNENWEPYMAILQRACSTFNHEIHLSYSSLGYFPTAEAVPECDVLLVWFNFIEVPFETVEEFYIQLFQVLHALPTKGILVVASSTKEKEMVDDLIHQAKLSSLAKSIVSDSKSTISRMPDNSMISSPGYSKEMLKFTVSAIFYSFLFPLLHEPPRLIFLDLDQTLLNGIISETDSSFLPKQFYSKQNLILSRLRKAGVILVLLTKNLTHDVHTFLANYPEFGLDKGDFLFIYCGWEKKSEYALQVLNQTKLHPSQCLFVDDNIQEILEMQIVFPDMKCLLATSEDEVTLALKRIFAGELQQKSKSSLNQSTLREADILAISERNALVSIDQSNDAQLELHKMLDTSIVASLLGPNDVERANELIRKTNQFNSTLRRTVLQPNFDQSSRVYICRVRDKFADSGIVSVLAISTDNEFLEFVISCRVLGRGLESFILKSMLELDSKVTGAVEYRVTFKEGPRNSPAKAFLSQYGNLCDETGKCIILVENLGEKSIYDLLVNRGKNH